MIAGLPASLARDVVRLFGHDRAAWAARTLLSSSGFEPFDHYVQLLADEGFLERIELEHHDDLWTTTIKGNALAMASFGKPISRATAERLLAGLIDRARTMNADPTRLIYVDRIRVYGSFLRPDFEQLGDVDVEVVLGRRVSMKELAAYGERSARNFSTYTAQLGWAQTEFVQQLRNRSQALSITLSDVTPSLTPCDSFTRSHDDGEAVPAPTSIRGRSRSFSAVESEAISAHLSKAVASPSPRRATANSKARGRATGGAGQR